MESEAPPEKGVLRAKLTPRVGEGPSKRENAEKKDKDKDTKDNKSEKEKQITIVAKENCEEVMLKLLGHENTDVAREAIRGLSHLLTSVNHQHLTIRFSSPFLRLLFVYFLRLKQSHRPC